LTSGNFASVEYLNDIVLSEEEKEKSPPMTEEELQVSIQLDYEEFIRKYILDLKYDNDKFKSGMLSEFDDIIRVFNESYKIKSD
jgi:hypothetical protein